MKDARQFCARLRALDKQAIKTLRDALRAAEWNLKEAALLVGLAGSSSLWRVAYDVPEVRALLSKRPRKAGRK